MPVVTCTLSPTAWLASGARGSGRGQTVNTLLSQTSAPRAGPQHNVWKADSCKPLKHMCHMSCMCIRSRVSCVVHVPCVTGLDAAVAQNIILLSSLPSACCPRTHVLALDVRGWGLQVNSLHNPQHLAWRLMKVTPQHLDKREERGRRVEERGLHCADISPANVRGRGPDPPRPVQRLHRLASVLPPPRRSSVPNTLPQSQSPGGARRCLDFAGGVCWGSGSPCLLGGAHAAQGVTRQFPKKTVNTSV